MKLSVTAFLMKEDRTARDILAIKGRKNHLPLDIDGAHCDFYWKAQSSTPRWVELFRDAPGVRSDLMTGKSVQGLLVIERQD
ncbi:MAG: hypothetical protein AAF229_05595 [Pseudomonadota bacterium]